MGTKWFVSARGGAKALTRAINYLPPTYAEDKRAVIFAVDRSQVSNQGNLRVKFDIFLYEE